MNITVAVEGPILSNDEEAPKDLSTSDYGSFSDVFSDY